MKKYKAILSLSGGLDSACALASLVANSKYNEIKTYSFKYGQRHEMEVTRAKKLVDLINSKGYKVTNNVIDLTSVFNDSASSLTYFEDIPEGHYADATMKSTVVENRNIIFSAIVFSKALALYKKNKENCEGVDIVLSVHAGDHTIYPDCKPESVNMARELYKISNWDSDKIDYNALFVNNTKGEVLKAGVEALEKLGFNSQEIEQYLGLTLTCYNPTYNNDDYKACGKCGSCTERLEAFEENNLKDPAKYI